MLKNPTIMVRYIALISMLVTPSTFLSADSWAFPKTETYTSTNGKYLLRVDPGDFAAQSMALEGGAKEPAAKATLFQAQPGNPDILVSQFELVNPIAPVAVLVADSGRYVVTFNDWHRVGYGPNVVVIYNADGTLVRRLALEDFLTRSDIESSSHSVSSIWWSGTHRLAEERNALVLQIDICGSYGECSETYHELDIELDTGLPVLPKRDLLPFFEYSVRFFESHPDDSIAYSDAPAELSCDESRVSSSDFESAAFVPFATLASDIDGLELPTYSEVGRKARISGVVVIEILVSETGSITCARALKSLPMSLTEKALESVVGWQLPVQDRSDLPARARVGFRFEQTLVDPLAEGHEG